MSVELIYHGHACFTVNVDDTVIMIDPFLNDNPLAEVGANDVEPHYVLVSHGHGDHIGDTVEIAKRTGAMTVSNFEIRNWLEAQGVQNTHGMHIGGGHNFPFGRVKLTIAHHGSILPDGSYGGNPAGFLLTVQGKKIYHACDTALFLDMSLIGEEGLDVAILPIGDNFTMGPDDALRAVQLLDPRVVIPIHYNTWEVIEQDAAEWAARVEARTSAKCLILKPGDRYKVER